jgi:parallel beta-helix repeat protein
MRQVIKCPVPSCGWEGEGEVCPNCGFPIGEFRFFLSGERVIYNEDIVKEFEELIKKHNSILNEQETIEVFSKGRRGVLYLEEAIERAKDGTTIYIRAGTHKLDKPLFINKAISLVGEGMSRTFILCRASGYVVRCKMKGKFSARDISFVHEGQEGANVVEVVSGRVYVDKCRFAGGVYDEVNKQGGIGLWLNNIAEGLVRGCKIEDNERHGILISGKSKLILEGNICKRNEYSGIYVCGRAMPKIEKSTCVENDCGIYICERAKPKIEGNTFKENGTGIAYSDYAGGIAKGNKCVENERDGIYVSWRANPKLEGNTCEGNKGSGIVYFDYAKGIARWNKCLCNEEYGIFIAGLAKPKISGNVFKGNKLGEING